MQQPFVTLALFYQRTGLLMQCLRNSSPDQDKAASLQEGKISTAKDISTSGCNLLVGFGGNLTHNALLSKLQYAKHLVSYLPQLNRLKKPWSARF